MEETKKLFPTANSSIISSDFKQSERSLKADIIIGTQIIAKGYDLPNLTLACILCIDIGVSHGDIRASERTYQILSQLSGRSGRAKQGIVLIQSYIIDDPIIKSIAENQRDSFYNNELRSRQVLNMPPFGRLLSLIVSHRNEREVLILSKKIAAKISQINSDAIRILGPVQAPIFLLKKKYRYRFLIVAQKNARLHEYTQKWLNNLDNKTLRFIRIDIDPVTFL